MDETPSRQRPTRREPLTIEQAISMAEAELAALRGWAKVDPRTPYRAEAAARLRWLANAISVAK